MRRNLLITGVVVGAFLMLGPVAGLLLAPFGMMKAFDDLSNDGISDPNKLSGHIGIVLMGPVIGLAAFALGLVFVIVCSLCLVRGQKEPPPVLASRAE